MGLPERPDRRRLDAYEGTNPSLVRSSTASGTEEPVIAGRHRLRDRRVQRTARRSAIEVVDARTRTAHYLTLDALAAGRLPRGCYIYIALCGQDALPVCLTEPGRNRCLSGPPIPGQRSRLSMS